MLKRLIISFLIILMINGTLVSFAAEPETVLTEGVYSYYITEDNTAELVSCSDEEGTVIKIPESLGGYKVTEIRGGAFSKCKSCKRFESTNELFDTIDGILYKEKTLVCYPPDRRSLRFSLPDHITDIGKYAFVGNAYIGNVSAERIKAIPEGCFAGCTKLKMVNADGITSIEDSAFAFCESLTDIEFPETLTKIGRGAFYGCGSLDELNFGDGIEEIGDMAFEKCVSVTEINIPEKVSGVEGWIFSVNPGLEKISVSEGNRFYYVENNVLYAKAGEKKLVFCPPGSGENVLTVSDDVIIIGRNALENHKTVKKVVLPDSVEAIESHAFYGCENLTDINLDGSVKKIGEYAFFGCTKLGDIRILSSTEEIDEGAFENCGNLNLYVADGSAAFQYAETENVKYTVDTTQSAVTPAHWADRFIRWSEENGITEGVTDYEVELNREGFSWLVVNFYENIAGEITEVSENPFSDTESLAVVKAYSIGILSGMGDGRFNPSAPITRQEMCVCFVKLISALGGEIPHDVDVTVFRDDEKIAGWAREYVGGAYKSGIITGFPDGKIAPDGNATIEEAVVMLYNVSDLV